MAEPPKVEITRSGRIAFELDVVVAEQLALLIGEAPHDGELETLRSSLHHMVSRLRAEPAADQELDAMWAALATVRVVAQGAGFADEWGAFLAERSIASAYAAANAAHASWNWSVPSRFAESAARSTATAIDSLIPREERLSSIVAATRRAKRAVREVERQDV